MVSDKIHRDICGVLLNLGSVDDIKALGYSCEDIHSSTLLIQNEDISFLNRILQVYIVDVSSIMTMFKFFLEDCRIPIRDFFVRNLLCAKVWYTMDPYLALELCSEILKFVLLYQKSILQLQEKDIYDVIVTSNWGRYGDLFIPMLLDHGLRVPDNMWIVHRSKNNFLYTENCTRFRAFANTRQSCKSSTWAWLNISKRIPTSFGKHFEQNLFTTIAILIWKTRHRQDLWLTEVVMEVK